MSRATQTLTPADTGVPAARMASVDIVRGAVMVLMAIDHVRVYAGVPAGGATPGLFFTRWVTHFCAPAFVFLAGASIYLWSVSRQGAPPARHLLLRGAWLVVLELTVLRVAWTFNFDFAGYEMAGVLWVIGWCMILMAALVRLPVTAVATIGVLIIAAHNLLDPYLFSPLGDDVASDLARILYVGFFAGPVRFGDDGPILMVLYSIVPWIGVMAAGYGFGRILTMDAARRRSVCLSIGLAAVALFVVLRGFNLYGDPQPWAAAAGGDGPQMPAALAFLNTSKYPASLLFLLMTLGPTIAALALMEARRGVIARWLTVFGRVPFFFYVLHIPLIHALALVVSAVRLGEISPWLFANHPMGSPPPPPGYTWSLPLLYLVWAVAIVMLYFACRWFARVKASRRDWWLSYI